MSEELLPQQRIELWVKQGEFVAGVTVDATNERPFVVVLDDTEAFVFHHTQEDGAWIYYEASCMFIEPESVIAQTQGSIRQTSEASDPKKAWSTSLVALADEKLCLRFPLVISLENIDEEIIASWPEIEAFGSGRIVADAINALKAAIASLYHELSIIPDEKLGKLPQRWKLALKAAIEEKAP